MYIVYVWCICLNVSYLKIPETTSRMEYFLSHYISVWTGPAMQIVTRKRVALSLEVIWSYPKVTRSNSKLRPKIFKVIPKLCDIYRTHIEVICSLRMEVGLLTQVETIHNTLCYEVWVDIRFMRDVTWRGRMWVDRNSTQIKSRCHGA